MKHTTTPSIILGLVILIFMISCNRSTNRVNQKESNSVWRISNNQEIISESAGKSFKHFQLVNLNIEKLEQLLEDAHRNNEVNAIDSKLRINFPFPDNSLVEFKMVETTLMEKELADKYPELKTYEGVATNNSAMLVRVTKNKLGIDAMILTPEGTIYIDPIELNDQILYLVYHKDDYISDKKDRFFELPIK